MLEVEYNRKGDNVGMGVQGGKGENVRIGVQGGRKCYIGGENMEGENAGRGVHSVQGGR